MNTSLSWVKAYVPGLEVTPEEFRDGMTLSGTKVEGFEKLDEDLDKIVIGQIVKIERHPDADKLVICQVNIGTEEIQIVTGAPNVNEGDKVPAVLVGGRVAGGHDGKVPGGMKIKKGKLRGVESYGMMCSIEELGSNTEMYPDAAEDGIYILPKDAPIGESAISYLGLDDVVFEFEVTSNRVDCYSIQGLAREAAATFGKELKLPLVPSEDGSGDLAGQVHVEVEAPDLCTRYCAKIVKNVTLAPSPTWMQRRLSAVGIRPINNIVDITNYVMEEYGQPMHAYDMATISGREIHVRRGKENETFQTLDGQERKVDSSILMICDKDKAVGIAGIMGGENSMITENVNEMLLEAACFDGTNIRLSSKKVGLRTDASGKFEKGLDPNQAKLAMERACQLIMELGVGEVQEGMVDIYQEERKPEVLAFEPDRINALLGTAIEEGKMLQYFEKLGFSYDATQKKITVPTYRQDIKEMADLAEEVARFYGYDKIPTTLPSGETTMGKLSNKLRVEGIARKTAQALGFSEGMTYSFESPKVFDKLMIPEDSNLRKTVVISNPLGEDYSIMRTLPLNGMLSSLSTNYNRRNKDVRLYELANVYLPKQLPMTELPEERMQFTLGMYGLGDFFTMKGVVEEFLNQVGMDRKVQYVATGDRTYLHPGRQAEILYDGEVIGYLGEVHPIVCENYDIGEKTYVAVLDMVWVTSKASFERKYQGLAKYPAVTRDLSMVVPKEIPVGAIEEKIEERGGKILESYQLFDLYEGDQIEKGYKSVAYSIVFRAKDKTLEEAEISAVMKKILSGLEDMGIKLRD